MPDGARGISISVHEELVMVTVVVLPDPSSRQRSVLILHRSTPISWDPRYLQATFALVRVAGLYRFLIARRHGGRILLAHCAGSLFTLGEGMLEFEDGGGSRVLGRRGWGSGRNSLASGAVCENIGTDGGDNEDLY